MGVAAFTGIRSSTTQSSRFSRPTISGMAACCFFKLVFKALERILFFEKPLMPYKLTVSAQN
jgi:hypothetical protein